MMAIAFVMSNDALSRFHIVMPIFLSAEYRRRMRRAGPSGAGRASLSAAAARRVGCRGGIHAGYWPTFSIPPRAADAGRTHETPPFHLEAPFNAESDDDSCLPDWSWGPRKKDMSRSNFRPSFTVSSWIGSWNFGHLGEALDCRGPRERPPRRARLRSAAVSAATSRPFSEKPDGRVPGRAERSTRRARTGPEEFGAVRSR